MGNVLDLCHSQIFGNKALGSYAPHPIPFQVMAIKVCDKIHLNAQYPATTWKKYKTERRLNDKAVYGLEDVGIYGRGGRDILLKRG